MSLRSAIKQSCDVYFYEVARRLGVDRLSVTAKEFGLGKKVFEFFDEEKKAEDFPLEKPSLGDNPPAEGTTGSYIVIVKGCQSPFPFT